MNPNLAVFLLLFGVVILIVAWQALQRKSCTGETEGRITDIISGGKGGLAGVEYTYRVQGQTYFGRAGRLPGNVAYHSLDEARTYLRGRTVTVHYNPRCPKRSWADTSSL